MKSKKITKYGKKIGYAVSNKQGWLLVKGGKGKKGYLGNIKIK